MKRHINIPIFIPHLGCPNQCVFCNQRTISGVVAFDLLSVKNTIDEALSTTDMTDECEIAFFGGSFTGIDRELMLELLNISDGYVKSGRVKAVRCSTRPDYINEEILHLLKRYNVKTIELGLQSTDSEVLKLTKRGHSYSDEKYACDLIVDYGFDLVGQMMIGLPGSTLQKELDTARFIIDSGAKAARIYPTVVFRDTELCSMSINREYTPLELEDAVARSAAVLELFIENKLEVIRIGLCSSENLLSDEKYYAGPNHSALGELVYSRLFLNLIKKEICRTPFYSAKTVEIFVSKGCLSKAIGQKRVNKISVINEFGFNDALFFEKEELSEYQIKINLKGTRG